MNKLGLDNHSVVLVISTEGDTDVQHYREVVWKAASCRQHNKRSTYSTYSSREAGNQTES